MDTASKTGSRTGWWLLVAAIPMALAAGFWFGRSGAPRAIESHLAESNSQEPETISTRMQNETLQILLPANMARSKTLARATIDRSSWNEERMIPAKLELDPGRHYAVTAPAEVIVDEFLVPLGDRVQRGEPLLVMSTSQITTLRGGLLRQELLTEKAKRALDWHKEIQSRIATIINQVQKGTEPVPDQWQAIDTEQTAEFGARIVGAYAKLWSAAQLSRISQRASNSGVIAEKSMVERQTDLESAKAALQGAIEQSRFEVQQAILAAESDLAAAEGALQSIQSDMRRFLGLRVWDEKAATELLSSDHPDRFVHRSPGDGIVLERYFANGERAAVGDLVVLVADTSRLWLVGDLRQQDWDLLQVHSGDTIEAEVVGLESIGRIAAKVEMMGGVVQTSSGSIRLTASLENSQGLLRPGMNARLVVSRPKQGLRVPETAIFSNDGKDYVLRIEDETTFSVVPVQLGTRQNNTVEIQHGLESGESVLVSGVFPIASQAFLQDDE
ncbi:MAG: efflux RND transporter periplasmic adaptor subunit [Pirellula sp.]|jgi:multidrug efflux pump subunit AcrA (membrane-fusion protein)|nr:efflux RND transporter periplasmic adaptor subunit [Pirellula sp.]